MSKLRVFGLEFDGLTDELLDEAARKTRDYMKPLVPRGETGKLKRSVGITRLSKYGRKVGAADQRKYPRIVLLDLDPIFIRPKQARVLRFNAGKGRGRKAAYAHWVYHPGGQRIISRTEDYIWGQMGSIADQVMNHYPKGG